MHLGSGMWNKRNASKANVKPVEHNHVVVIGKRVEGCARCEELIAFAIRLGAPNELHKTK